MTNKSILDEHQNSTNSWPKITKENGRDACRNNRCNHVNTFILEMMPGKRRRGAIDNINNCPRESL